MTPHIESKKEDIANVVLMPGDPLRAKYIADNYLSEVRLVNSVRNIYAYTGKYNDKNITVMASGMGMPSIGIYSYELFKFYDVDTIIRIGSCGAYSSDIDLFSLVLATSSYTQSSYAKTQGYSSDIIKSSTNINDIIKDTALKNNISIKEGMVHSTDVFYDNIDIHDYYNKGCICTEMESFALFYNAYKLNKNASCILTVTDNLVTSKKATIKEREKSLNEMIKLALESAIKL